MFEIRSDAYALVDFPNSGLDVRKLSADSAILLVNEEAISPNALLDRKESNKELSDAFSSQAVYSGK